MEKFDDIAELNRLVEEADLRAGALTDLAPSIAEGLDRRIQQIDCDIQKIHLLAVSVADVFWEEVEERRKSQGAGSGIGIRVRRRGTATEVSYYKNSFTVNNQKAKFRKGLHIRKSSENRYLERDIGALYPWEKELIRELENTFSFCRSISKALVSSRRQLRRARAEFEKMG